MSEWIAAYQSGAFAKIELINDTDLEGYQFVSSGVQSALFGQEFETHKYQLLTTTKSAMITLLDLGVSLTGEDIVLMTYKSESLWTRILGQI